MSKKIEYKKFAFEIKQSNQDEEYYYFEGYLSTFDNVDHGRDTVVKGAFKKSLEQKMPKLFWSHKQDEPLGIFTDAYEDDKGLFVKGKMPLEDTFVKGRIVPQMKVGSIGSMSIGYIVEDKEYKNNVRYLKQLDLLEGSLVTIPMNDQANLKTKAISSFQDELPIAPRDTIWDASAARARVQVWAGADDNSILDPDIQQMFARAFVYYDEEDPDYMYYYQLQIADVIEGELTIVPRAVFAASAALRSGYRVYIPDRDIPRATMLLEQYYQKMGMESPFSGEKGFRIDDFKCLEPRMIERLFKKGCYTTSKNAKTLVSYIKNCTSEDEEYSKGDDVEQKSLLGVLTEINKI